MDGPGTVNARGPWRRLALLLALGFVLFFWRLGSHDLWPPDEPRFALVAKEMWARGDYSVLSLNNHLYTDKPPLFFWAINGFGRLLGGIDEWAARLPSAVSAVLALLLIERLGAWLYDRRTGLLAALVFATSLQILERGRWASIDMTLNLFVLSAVVLLWRGRAEQGGGRTRIAFAWVMMALATLAKGPVGLILPILAVLPSAFIERDFRSARRMFSPIGTALFLLISLSWFGLFAWRLGLRYALWVLMHQNVERYVGAWNATHPVWYYLWRFPLGFFPWIVFLPWGIAQALSREDRERRSAALLLVTWIASILLFFSFSTGKRGVYIIPLYPAAAILVARQALLPWVTRRQNISHFASEVKARLDSLAAFATTEEKRDAWVFYTGRFAEEADTPPAIVEYLSRPGPRQLLIEDDLLRAVDLSALPGVVEDLRGTVAGQPYHLLSKDAAR